MPSRDIDDCSEDERGKLQPGRSIIIKYDPDHPDAFVWIDEQSMKASAPEDESKP